MERSNRLHPVFLDFLLIEFIRIMNKVSCRSLISVCTGLTFTAPQGHQDGQGADVVYDTGSFYTNWFARVTHCTLHL